jgi:hypothetical protein
MMGESRASPASESWRALRGRPLVVLGVNSHDRRDVLRRLRADGEVTWRCWWDGDGDDGPIATRWNIRGYPTFVVLDHAGLIRFKRGDEGPGAARRVHSTRRGLSAALSFRRTGSVASRGGHAA